jgi:hypothetical protein
MVLCSRRTDSPGFNIRRSILYFVKHAQQAKHGIFFHNDELQHLYLSLSKDLTCSLP